MESGKTWRVVAGLDFGTTYSAFAYSILQDGSTTAEIVTNPVWSSGGADLQYPKTPTTVLLDKRGEFDSFGFEAESKYFNLVLRGVHNDWFYFSRFKMKLYREYGDMEKLSKSFRLKDENGKTMQAMKVFSVAIGYLKRKLEETLKLNGHDVLPGDILWVLTVPAIWNAAAKQFMRESAEMAGIPKNQLTFALEPEAAGLYVLRQHHSSDGLSTPRLQPETNYMNVDLGGGTADVTVHRVTKDGQVEELFRPTGGYWGGTQVDKSFDQLLVGFCNLDVLTFWKTQYLPDYLDLRKDFEGAKRIFNNSSDVTIRVPSSLIGVLKEKTNRSLEDIITQLGKQGDYIYTSGRLIITAQAFSELFKTSVDGISNLIKSMIQQQDGISTIVLVGGFSQTPPIKTEVETCALQKKIRIIIPDQPSLAVVRGATLYGRNQNIVKSRVSPYTYGFSIFKSKTQDDTRGQTSTIDGVEYTNDHFDVHVRAGDRLIAGKSNITRKYTSINRNQTTMVLFLYCTRDKEPKFCNDKGCQRLAEIVIDLPEHTEASVIVQMIYSGTEIEVQAFEENTGIVSTVTFDPFREDFEECKGSDSY